MKAFWCNSVHIACLAELLQPVTYFRWSRLFYNSARRYRASTANISIFHLLALPGHCANIPGNKNLVSQLNPKCSSREMQPVKSPAQGEHRPEVQTRAPIRHHKTKVNI